MENLNENIVEEQKPGQEVGDGSFALASCPETENLTQNLNEVHELLLGNQPVTKGDIDKLRQNIAAITIDFFGMNITLRELRDNPKIKENLEFFREILSGNFEHVGDLTFITPLVAEALTNCEKVINLRKLGDNLPDFLIEAISRFRSEELQLGVTSLTGSLTRSLALCKGGFSIENIKELSDEMVAVLASHEGVLAFQIESLSPQAAESLSHHEGDLWLTELKSLSDEAAESLSRHKEMIVLKRIENLSDEAIKSLIRNGQVSFRFAEGSLYEIQERIMDLIQQQRAEAKAKENKV